LAKYDLALGWEEFEECTPGMIQALCKRRNIRIKYERYAHGITASLIYNTNRGKDDPAVVPYDFIRDDNSRRKKEELLKAKAFIKKTIGGLPFMTPMEKLQEVRLKVIADVRASGRDDAEELVNECWPSLTPKE
jgi:hypothetical protein